MSKTRVLVVGSGGREHALAWRIALDGRAQVFLAPGNDGSRLDANLTHIDIAASDYEALVQFGEREKVDLVVIGPDQALADGLTDRLEAKRIPVFGPTRAAAQLESSKAFAKEVMAKVGIPTARFQVFTDAGAAKAFLRDPGWKTGWALKADGLALGKGVVVTDDLALAAATIDEFMVDARFGDASRKIVIEEKLVGRELSAFYICDGREARELAFACDHKQLLDGGKGPNTGGMGAYSPAEWLPAGTSEAIRRKIVDPLLKEMDARGIPYRGTLYAGLMITSTGPHVIEFNARFGDPETQVILPLLEGDFLGALMAVAEHRLASFPRESLRRSAKAGVHVVLAAHGYPEQVRKGDTVRIDPSLLPGASAADAGDTKLFFAGVKRGADGSLVTNGGRIMGLTALAPTLAAARARAYDQVAKISFAGMQKRNDVGTPS